MPDRASDRIPTQLRGRFEEIVARTDAFAAEHLNAEYAELCRRMAAALARRRPSPLERGETRTWAGGIVYAAGWVNFLGDPAQRPHLSTAELAERAGVGQSTLALRFRDIRGALDLVRFDPEWTLPGRLLDNPLVWMLTVDGIPVDVRRESRALQEEAFRLGLIPFVPADGPPSAAGGGDPSGSAAAVAGSVARTKRGARGTVSQGGERGGAAGRVYQLKITLQDVRPAVWRRVLVPEDATLAGLHRVIQAAMGWEDAHLWRFEIGDEEYGEGLDGGWGDEPPRSAAATRLSEVAGAGDVLLYEYDFGDAWEHRVRVEKVLPAEPGGSYPVCVAAERACPPEDCGGVPGYEHLLEVLADPADAEHDDLLEWVGEDFDPEAVDLEEINRRLARSRPRAGGPPRGAGGASNPAEAAMRELRATAEQVLQQVLAEDPDADIDTLNTALQAATAGYNLQPQAELGGLPPTAVRRLLDADWGTQGAVRLDESLQADALAGSATLHDARLVLELVGAEGQVRATPKGNLPRALVAAFRERMQSGPQWHADELAERKIVNEEDLRALHVVRILLELGGLLKRRKGQFSLTRVGQRLAGEPRAGELFATLFRTHFRRFNLGYLDGVEPVPGLQQTVAYSLYRFGRVAGDWRGVDELVPELLLPGVREEVLPRAGYDPMQTAIRTRVLRPLEGFGLAESQALPREPGQWLEKRVYRRTPLFDRFLVFDVGGG